MRRALLYFLLCSPPALAADWPQFRGPNGCGVAEGDAELPVKFGAGEGVAWSTPLPPGLSSPVLAGSRIYLTGLREKDLVTLALERSSGKLLWEKKAPAEKLEEVHSTSSPAASTPASDGERVVVFFGSFGLLAYDPDGKEIWRLPLGPFKNPFGASSSPILAGDLAILNCDQDQGSFLIAADKKTGRVRYRVERPEFPRGFATPIIWDEGGIKQIVVPGTLHAKAYALDDGRELWSASGLARIVNPSPILGQGLLFIASYSPGGDTTERISMPLFEEYAKVNDADKNGKLTESEIPAGEMKNRFLQLDADKDGFITKAEWENMARIFDAAKNSIVALRPGHEEKHEEKKGAADKSGAKVEVSLAWQYDRGIPYVPSPLYYKGLIYMVKDGGILTALDAATGKVLKQARLPAGGAYYASPVAGDGKVYLTSLGGEVAVVSAGPSWEVLASNPFNGERTAATPAIADGRLYVRTEKRLLACNAAHNAQKETGGGAGR